VLERIINQRLNVAQTEQYIKKLIEATGNGKNSSVASYLCVVKDVRLFVNTINKAVDTMLCSGINAESITNENEEFIEYIVKIPKTQVYKKKEEGKKKETIKAG